MIVDSIYYVNEYMGESVPATVFPRYSKRAEEAILTYCGHPDICKLYPFQIAAVKSAICAQIEYYSLNGIGVATTGETGSSYTIGKISVSGGSGSGNAKASWSMICPAAVASLEQSGLNYPAVPAVGNPMYTGAGWIG